MSSFGAQRSLVGLPGGLAGREPIPARRSRSQPDSELSPQCAWSVVIERIRAVTGATAAAIALREAGEFICKASAGAGPQVGAALEQNQGLTAECLHTGETAVCHDAEQDGRTGLEQLCQTGVRSAVVMPLLAKGSVEGLIAISSPRPAAFDAEVLDKLRAVAWAIEIILFNSSSQSFVDAVKHETGSGIAADSAWDEAESEPGLSEAYAASDEQPWFEAETSPMDAVEMAGRRLFTDEDVAKAIATEWNLADDNAAPAPIAAPGPPPQMPVALADSAGAVTMSVSSAPANAAISIPESAHEPVELDEAAFATAAELPVPGVKQVASAPIPTAAIDDRIAPQPLPQVATVPSEPENSSVACVQPAETSAPAVIAVRSSSIVSERSASLSAPEPAVCAKPLSKPLEVFLTPAAAEAQSKRWPRIAIGVGIAAALAVAVWLGSRTTTPGGVESQATTPEQRTTPQSSAPNSALTATQQNQATPPPPGSATVSAITTSVRPILPTKSAPAAQSAKTSHSTQALESAKASQAAIKPPAPQPQPAPPAASALALPAPQPRTITSKPAEEPSAPPPLAVIATKATAPALPSSTPPVAAPVPVLTPRIDATWVMLGSSAAGKASVVAPALVKKVLPSYPETARAAKRQGSVVLQAAIDSDGRVSSLRVVDGDSALAEAASGALKTWQYEPARQGDKPVGFSVLVTVNFRLAL